MLDFAKSIMCNAKAEVAKVGNSMVGNSEYDIVYKGRALTDDEIRKLTPAQKDELKKEYRELLRQKVIGIAEYNAFQRDIGNSKIGNGSGSWRGNFYEDSAGNSATVMKSGNGWEVVWEDFRGHGKSVGVYKDQNTAKKVAEEVVESEMPDRIKANYRSQAVNSWEPMQAKKYYEEAKKSGDNKKIDEIKKAIDAEYYAAYKAYDDLKQRHNDLQINQDRPGRVPNLEKARSNYELWKIVKSTVGNSMGKDIYQHKLDPNQYMVVDWDKDTVTIIVNGAVRDVIKSTDKVAYAVSHVYKKVNSMNKTGNETMHEWATSKPKSVGNYSKGQSLGESGGRKYVYGGEINGTHIVYVQPGGTSYTFSSEQEIKDWLRSSHIGNAKVINSDREFFKKLADDAKEREEKYDADIEKVGNANLETSVEKGKLGMWNWYIFKDGSIVAGGTTYTEAAAKEMLRKALEKEKVGNSIAKIGNFDWKDPQVIERQIREAIKKGEPRPFIDGLYHALEKAKKEREDFKKKYGPNSLSKFNVDNSKAENGLARARNAMAKNKKTGNAWNDAVKGAKKSDFSIRTFKERDSNGFVTWWYEIKGPNGFHEKDQGYTTEQSAKKDAEEAIEVALGKIL